MTRDRILLGAAVVAALVATGGWRVMQARSARQQPRPPVVLALGPRVAPVNTDVPSVFDGSGRRMAMRVCADPNNLPFSDSARAGFENRIAAMIASDLGLQLQYSWWPQRRGFVRNTLKLGNCDVVMGISSRSELVVATRPYYRSTYVFVTRRDRGLHIQSLDDPVLRHLKIGVPLTGGDADPPPGESLARRGLVSQVEGFPIYGDYTQPNPPARLIDAVADGKVDVAIVWGPFAGYFARRSRVPLTITPVRPAMDGVLPYEYDISLGVRHGDSAWRRQLQGALDRHRADIRRLLEQYGVPLVAANPAGGEHPDAN